MNLQLSIAMTLNPRTRGVFDGSVKPDGIDLIPTALHPSEMFWRQLKFADFDISELSFSSLSMAKSRGDERFLGLPIFTTRHFFQNWILVRKGARIETPADMKGKRVGVPEYQQTAAVWSRGILEHDFGVAPKDMEFWMERAPSQSHGGSTGFTPPPGVTLHRIPPDKNIGTMMLSGELDATLLYFIDRNLIDRSTADLWNHPYIEPLFRDPIAEGMRYYKKTGLFPINHGMAVRKSIVDQHPWVVLNLYKAFVQASEIANQQRLEHVEYHVAAGMLPSAVNEALRTPLVQHGVKANRAVLETAALYSHEQGLTPRVIPLDEVFAPSTMDL
jgi:4,5-dihydroxyphthalate decarboxylase